eukprot:CAMPEP_0206139378 /NCGR_PEP_ID=MMETSP1473-20131121/5719_1 /ASSEMBLY_ACC=CAM_ASM_001109 /TAXON_ID=1461547 /ORGANISM="Stichococcus sp, Strain RCC1054" /LENGTH=542 /DNA_ID=CAMNT_0053533143 /DNA_START=35 /DNA_END=1663 /DNA_ORIENTATION=-
MAVNGIAGTVLPCTTGRACMPVLVRRPAFRSAPQAAMHVAHLQGQRRHVEAIRRRCSASQNLSFFCGIFKAAVRSSISTAAASSQSTEANVAYDIQIKEKLLHDSRVQVTVTVPPQASQVYFDAILWKKHDGPEPAGAQADRTIKMLRMVHGNQTKIRQEAVEAILTATLPKALQKWEDSAINESLIIETQLKDMVKSFNADKPFTFVVSVDVSPQPTWKQPYRDIEIEVDAAGNEASDREKVETMLLQLQQDKSKLRIVQGRGLERGDIAICQFNAFRAETGEPIPGSQQANMRLNTATADTSYIPGLVAGMEGMVPGDRREVAVTFPDNWEPESLAGLAAKCDVVVKELFCYDLIELNDEFAKENIPQSTGIEDARQKLLEAQHLATAEATNNRVVEALGKAVSEAVELDVPQFLLRSTGEQEYQTYLLNMQREGKITKEIVTQLATEALMKNFIVHKRDYLEGLVRASLGFDDIFKQEKLQASDEEIEAEFKRAVADFDRVGHEYDEDKLREQARETIKGNKTLEFLIKTCKIKVNPKA